MKQKNLIITAYCDINGMKSGVNIKKTSKSKDIYYKNAIVSLLSFKKTNDCDVAFFTNIKPPKEYSDILEKNNIFIINCDFDSFNFKNDIFWGLAFYKLCALKHAIELEYDNFLIVDNDTYCQENLDDMWAELKNNILLYDINHRLKIRDCFLYNEEVLKFTNKNIFPTNYGGEFIAGSKENLNLFLKDCSNIFDLMIKKDFKTNFGDEFIIRLAAHNEKDIIKNASGYIFRFWTKSFRLVSTCFKFNAISIIHVPDEKEDGMIKIYSIFKRFNKLPNNKKIWKILHLSRVGLKQKIKNLIKKTIKS